MWPAPEWLWVRACRSAAGRSRSRAEYSSLFAVELLRVQDARVAQLGELLQLLELVIRGRPPSGSAQAFVHAPADVLEARIRVLAGRQAPEGLDAEREQGDQDQRREGLAQRGGGAPCDQEQRDQREAAVRVTRLAQVGGQ